MNKLEAIEYLISKYNGLEYYDEWIEANYFCVIRLIMSKENITKEEIDVLVS